MYTKNENLSISKNEMAYITIFQQEFVENLSIFLLNSFSYFDIMIIEPCEFVHKVIFIVIKVETDSVRMEQEDSIMGCNGCGADRMSKELDNIIAKHKEMKGALIPVLHEAQGLYGYLPMKVQKQVAEGLGIALADVYGVVTFYTQFSLYPKGKYKVSVCLGTACYVKGAGKIMDKVMSILKIKNGECTSDMNFSLDACRCIGACGLAPVITINDDVYGRLTAEEVPAILEKYIKMASEVA